jgi:hypothetical protein
LNKGSRIELAIDENTYSRARVHLLPKQQTSETSLSILSFQMFKKEIELGVIYTSIFATTFHKMVILSLTSIYSNQNLVKGHL